MARYRNASSSTLVFAGITNPATGTTLVLDAAATVDLPKDPGHPLLVLDDGSKGDTGTTDVEARVKKLTGPKVNAELEAAGLPTDGDVPTRKARLVAHLTA